MADDWTYPVPNDLAALLAPYLKPGVDVPSSGPNEVPVQTPDDVIKLYTKSPDATAASPKKKFGWADTWPVQIAKTIASGLTLPGDVYQGNATVPQSAALSPTGEEDTSNIGRLTNLAGVVGTGAIPNVTAKAAPLIDANTATLADLARNTYDIPLRGGQISANRSVNYLDSVLQDKPFSGMAQSSSDQSAAFNRAVSNTIGENTDKITPDVMDAAKKRLGARYEDIASKSTIQADDKLGSDLNGIASDANTVLAPSERTIIHGQISNILDKIQGTGEIDGKTYQALIKTGSPLDRATKSGDTNVKYYAGQVKQSLLDALGRSVSPELQDQLAATNSQYKAMKTIEPLVEKSTTGDISPALLMGVTRQSYGNMAYGGGGDLANLSRIGQRFLKEPPNSGTANRLSAMKILGIGGASGVEAGLAFHDPMMAAKIGGLAALAGVGKGAVNAGVGSVLRSDWYANKLINSALPGRTPNMLDKLTNSAIPYYPPLPIMGVAPQNAYQPQ
jgi:hypothetical protein